MPFPVLLCVSAAPFKSGTRIEQGFSLRHRFQYISDIYTVASAIYAYFFPRLIKFANNRYAPGTPAGNCR